MNVPNQEYCVLSTCWETCGFCKETVGFLASCVYALLEMDELSLGNVFSL